jgi:glycosyltransferase involved in cell wall biosynthesis
MKICLDIQSSIGLRAGVGRYTHSLAGCLPSLAGPADSLTYFYFDFRRQGSPFQDTPARLRSCRLLPGALVQKAWTHLHWPPYDTFAGKHDVYHFPNFFLPPLRDGKSVVSIHDVSFLRYPGFAESRNLRYLSATIPRTVAQADALITISHFSASEISSLLHVDPAKIHVTYLAVAPHMKPAEPDRVAQVRQRLGLSRPYLLTVGTLEPRKNIAFLVDVFEKLAADYEGDLVLAGSPGWHVEPILERIARSPVARRIRLLHYVPEADLPALYSGADLFLFASHYEGFGFPPLESMSCGVPVVSSPGGSLREVLGEAAEILDPSDPAAWRDRIAAVLNDPARRHSLITAGFARAARYNWAETARQTWDVYRKAAAS